MCELAGVLTVAELSLWMAYVEQDGPWWGEREAAYLKQLCSVQAATGGADIPADRFGIDWTVGPRDEPAGHLLAPADGLAIFAARHGLDVVAEG